MQKKSPTIMVLKMSMNKIECVRVCLKSWTATFRYPSFQSGYQPTLPIPPLSTIFGILSAVKGEIVGLNDVEFVGYIFRSKGKGVDLETTYKLESGEKDIIKREFLVNNMLYLYLPKEWGGFFKKPKYQILLGRSCDLATVEEIKYITLETKEHPEVWGSIFQIDSGVSGIVHALPVEYDYTTIPRNAKIVKPFILVNFRKNNPKYNGALHYDEELDVGVMLYEKSHFG